MIPKAHATTILGLAAATAFALSLSACENAVLSAPSSAIAAIAGPSAGSGGPSAVTDLQLTNQGGPNNSVEGARGSLANYQQISWHAATPGANPIASYNVYRNGVLYANTTRLTYTDTAATNSNSPLYVLPATVYSYNVAAVDNKGNVGPQAAQMSVYGYQNGHSNWSSRDLSYGTAKANYASTAGSPQGGPFDISVYLPDGGGFLPTADAPQSPNWDLEAGAFNYFVVDFNPGSTTDYQLPCVVRSRLPPGDVFGWVPWPDLFDYGPAPKANTWATYKIPLSAFHMGFGHFTGSITGTTLTVTAVSSGVVDSGGYVTGPGVPVGTYIIAHGQPASIGTFTVAGPGINNSTSVPSTQMTYQFTTVYKIGFQPTTQTSKTMYFNNMGFTVN